MRITLKDINKWIEDNYSIVNTGIYSENNKLNLYVPMHLLTKSFKEFLHQNLPLYVLVIPIES